jgi:polysaccharide chain length determinant protein (PEP-CTERM system associated)
MEQLLTQVTAIARSMWRFRWPSVLIAWLVGIIAAVTVYFVPDKYEATARVFVDTQSILKPLMSGLAVQPNVEQQVVMLSRTLINRPNVEKLIRMADLDLKSVSKAEQEALVARLMKSLEIKSVGRDNLYLLTYRDEEAAKAQRVIQSLVSIFVESSLGASRKDSDTARVFINDQIKNYEAKLQEAEARLKEFRIRNIDLQTAEGKDSAAQLSELSAQLRQAKLELLEAEQARDAIRKQISDEKAVGASVSASSPLLGDSARDISTPELDSRIGAQQKNLDALLQRYTEQHPDVVSTRRLIRDLEEQKQKEIGELRKAAMEAPAGPSVNGGGPLASAMSQMLASSEVQIAALKARVAEYTSRLSQARESMKSAPQLEAEAAQLNRDYGVHKQNYDALVARRESATMSGELESAAGVADFRLIDPPRVAPKPVSPNRPVLLLMAMVVALGAGLFTAFAASQLRPVFHGVTDLRSKIELPLLGVVSMVTSATDIRRERLDLLRFMMASGGLIGVFVAGLIAMSVMAARQG